MSKGIRVKERDYEVLKKIKREKSFPEYLEEVVEAVEYLERVRDAFKKATGREFRLKEVVEELVALGILERRVKESHVSLCPVGEKEIEMMEERMKMGRHYAGEKGVKSLREGVRNFFYVPDSLLERIKEVAKEYKETVPRTLYESIEVGTRIVGKSFFVLDKETSDRLVDFTLKAPEEAEKLRKDVKRIINLTVKRELAKREKKLKRR